MRRRLLTAVAVTALVFVACFAIILGVLLLAQRGGLAFGGNRVALVEVDGVIVDSTRIVRQLEEHRDDASIRAVVLRVQSPGGVVAPTQEIYDAVRRVRAAGKPVVVSMGAVAASGGYYVAAAAERIVANPGSLTGSIGVLMQLADIEGLLKRVGVRYEVVKAGRFKDLGSLARGMTEAERAVLQGLLDDMHDQFVTAVAQGRGLERQAVLALADGRVFSGRRAMELGLVDTLGGLEDAIREAGDLAGIPGEPKVVWPERRFRWSDLLGWLGSQTPLGGVAVGRGALTAAPFVGATKLPLYLME